MKSVFRNLFIVSILLFSYSVTQAQMVGGGREMDPTKRAEQQTANMTEVLGLSEAQAVKVKEINIKYNKKMQELFNANQGGDMTAIREKMGQMQQEQNNEFKVVMTSEQFEKWVKYQEEQRNLRGQGRRGNN